MEIDYSLNNQSQTSTDNSNKILEVISNGDMAILKSMIKNQDFQFWAVQDSEGFTCLIKSAFLNQTEMTLLLIENAKNSPQLINDVTAFHSWINKKADNGFNALHYSAFRGNVKSLEKLIENGADLAIKNNNGLSVMHMAAQGDRPNALVYFKEKHGLKIDCLDAVDSTPLHWCSYMGAENSLDYLVSWEANLNAKDKDGFTPLHLAVMTEKTKMIKKLIKIGADINSQDGKNRKPTDLAIIKNNLNIIDILNENINFFTCKFNYSEQNRDTSRWGFLFAFLLYIFLLEAVLLTIILPYANSIYRYELSIGLFIAILFSFFLLHFSNPGYKYTKINKSPLTLALDGESLTNICPYCSIYKSSLSKHCYKCNKCIDNFDHHCVWIDNCIGKRNYNNFIIFLIIFSFKLLLTAIYAFESKN